MGNDYLKRGKGKSIATIKKYNFFSNYRKNATLSKLESKQYSSFTKDLLTAYSEAIVKENLQLKLGKVGIIRIQSKKLHFFTKDGVRAKTLQVDWQSTWKFWENKYEDKTRDEIKNITGKKVVYFENEHTNGEFYRHLWDNMTTVLKYKRFYKFKASRQYSRLIAKTVKDKNRKVFYYG